MNPCKPVYVRRLSAVALLTMLVVLVSGCQTTPLASPRMDPEGTYREYRVGQSVNGRPIDIVVLGSGPDTTFILATIHGNEQAGTPLVEKLIEHLSQRPYLLRDKTVVIMPVANPDGMAQNTRHNARGVDLNRNFAAPNRTSAAAHGPAGLSEPESRVIEQVIRDYQPDRVVAIHQPLNCIDYDGPGESLAYQMATLSGLPVKKLGARPGSLGSFVGLGLNRPIITVELPRQADQLDRDALWDRYGPMLLTAVTYRTQAK